MTAHRSKPTINPERIDWFARYYLREPAWGVFHVALDDGNWHLGAADTWKRPGTGCVVDGQWVPARWDVPRAEWPADVRDAAEWFDKLTPSQRRRLGRRAERRADDLASWWRTVSRDAASATVDGQGRVFVFFDGAIWPPAGQSRWGR